MIRFSKIALCMLVAGFGLFAAVDASAECYVCDEVITLDNDQAKCFSSKYDDILKAIEAAPEKRVPVNLLVCSIGTKRSATRGVVNLPTTAAPQTAYKFNYLLDKSGAECLNILIKEHKGELTPAKTFDLLKECKK